LLSQTDQNWGLVPTLTLGVQATTKTPSCQGDITQSFLHRNEWKMQVKVEFLKRLHKSLGALLPVSLKDPYTHMQYDSKHGVIGTSAFSAGESCTSSTKYW